MAGGRFARAVRSRAVSPRRARAIAALGGLLLIGALAVVATVRAPQLPHGMGVASGSLARAATTGRMAATEKHAHTAAAPAGPAVLAEIKTCPACRLNALPKVKKFVHGDAKLFPTLKITFEFGHDPELYLLDAAGAKKETIDLATLEPTDIIKKLYQHGLRPSERTESITAALGANYKLHAT